MALSCATFALIACGGGEADFAAAVETAEAHRAAGELDAAISSWRQALRIKPRDPRLNLNLALDLESTDQREDAAFYFAEARRLDGTLIEAGVGEIRVLLEDNPERAWRLAGAMITSFPDQPSVRTRAAEAALARGDLAAARYHALTATELAPVDPEPHLVLGRTYETRGDLDKALEEAERALELGAPRWRGLALRARILGALPEQRADAKTVYLSALRAANEAARPVGPIADEALEIARSDGDHPFEHAILSEWVLADSAPLDAWKALAERTSARGESDDVVWAQLFDRDPKRSDAHLAYVDYLRDRGLDDAALAHLRSNAAVNRDAPELLLAHYLLELDASDEPRSEPLTWLRDAFPDHPERYHAEGRRSLSSGEADDAARHLRRAAQLAPRPGTLADLARSELTLGNATEAAIAAGQALDTPIGSGRLRQELRILRIDAATALGDWPQVIEQFDALVRLERPLEPSERLQLARAHYRVGTQAAARTILEDLLASTDPPLEAFTLFFERHGQDDPRGTQGLLEAEFERSPSPSILALLVRADLARGDRMSAKRRLDSALGENASAELRLLRASIHSAAGRPADAADDAWLAFQTDPRHPNAVEALLSTHLAADRVRAALEHLEKRSDELGAVGLAAACRASIHVGELARAEELCSEALRLDPAEHGAKRDLAFLLARRSSSLDRALNLAQEAVSAAGGNPENHATLGYIYWKKRLLAPAIATLRRAAGTSSEVPTDITGLRLPDLHSEAAIRLYLSYALTDADADEEALRERELAIALAPGIVERIETMGVTPARAR